jgi:hypothetical protein
VRHGTQQGFAFFQRLAHQAELEIFKIAQPAVEQLCRGRGRRLRQIAHFRQRDRQAAAGRVAGDAAPVDAAADDEQIDYGL